ERIHQHAVVGSRLEEVSFLPTQVLSVDWQSRSVDTVPVDQPQASPSRFPRPPVEHVIPGWRQPLEPAYAYVPVPPTPSWWSRLWRDQVLPRLMWLERSREG